MRRREEGEKGEGEEKARETQGKARNRDGRKGW